MSTSNYFLLKSYVSTQIFRLNMMRSCVLYIKAVCYAPSSVACGRNTYKRNVPWKQAFREELLLPSLMMLILFQLMTS